MYYRILDKFFLPFRFFVRAYKLYNLLYLCGCATGTAVLQKWRYSASHDSFAVGSSAALRLNVCAKNPPLRQAWERYQQQGKKTERKSLWKQQIIYFTNQEDSTQLNCGKMCQKNSGMMPIGS